MTLLEIEMVPSCTWGVNVRAVLKASQWNKLRVKVYARAGNKCEICGGGGTMEAHEIWEYDDENKIQKLTGLICLCKKCHMAKHFGRTQLMGKEKLIVAHMQKVNNWTFMEVKKHHAEKTAEWNEREKFEWNVDISQLDKLMNEILGQ